jgi:hypothetical protein
LPDHIDELVEPVPSVVSVRDPNAVGPSYRSFATGVRHSDIMAGGAHGRATTMVVLTT